MRNLLLLLILLTVTFKTSIAQVDLNDNCTLAYNHIIALRFDDARIILEQEKAIHPENLIIPYLENYMDFLTVFIGEDEEEFDFLEENKSLRIDQIKKLDDSSRFKKYMLGNIHLQWAVARLKFKQYLTAAIEINKAYRLLSKNAEEFPDFIPNNISMGVLHIMIGMVPDKYQWLLDLIRMDGSVEQGREELYLVMRMSNENEVYHYLHDETLFYLGFVELNIQPDPEQIQTLLEELKQSSDYNLLLTYLQINILMKTGQNDEVLQLFNNMDWKNSGYLTFHFLDYLHAESQLRNLSTVDALQYYETFLDNYKGRNYVKDAWRKKAWACLIDGNTDGYHQNIGEVSESGYDDVDIDQEAEREAASGKPPNVDLIKGRLLFDGGYYTRAIQVLSVMDTSFLTQEEKVERLYRKARIYHEMGQTETAKDYYLMTIEQGSEMEKYFAGNSALKLGEIYESEGNFTTALFYYKLCLDLEFEEYEASIHAKANAAVERIED